MGHYGGPIIDYASQLWAPHNGPWLRKFENILKSFIAKISGLGHLDYWTRLKELNIYSIQRRFERYRTLYTWKILKGLVPNCDLIWSNNSRSGTTFCEPSTKAHQIINRTNSFHFTGTRLYNILPRNLRDTTDIKLDEWKSLLDKFLMEIPDNPHIDRMIPEPCDRLSTQPFNSILSWSRHLKISNRRTQDDSLYISL